MKKGALSLAVGVCLALLLSLSFPYGGYACEVKVWDDGGADSNWSTPENWAPDGVPGPYDTVVFDDTSDTDCIIDIENVGVAWLTLDTGYTSVVTMRYDVEVIRDLLVKSGTILCEGDPTAINEASGGTEEVPHGQGIVITARNVFVESSGSISADYQGFDYNQGPGAGGLHSGGSYGGYGGRGGWGIVYGTYGSFGAPTALGSGGGDTATAGSGGGAIKLNVIDTLSIDGTVSASGANGGNYGGGGAGGSLWLIADTLAGSGTIAADGGDGHFRSCGGGGGGRISLQWNRGNRTFSGNISAEGGSSTSIKGVDGHHGTLYVYVPDCPQESWNELWNTNYPVNGSVALVPGEYDIAELEISSGCILECQGDPDDGDEGSGVVITSENVTVEAEAWLSANGLGFLRNDGPGAGGYGSGASHGGYGGMGNYGTINPTYGSPSAPTSLGSGGGHLVNAGEGGGALKLSVTDTLTVNGTVSASGADCSHGNSSGGGAGGSLWLIADTLAGAGAILADGGDGYETAGGGGAGGRISLQWNSGNKTFSGTIRAVGGGSGTKGIDGHHGTLNVLVPDDADNSWNELWNADSSVNDSVALAPGEYDIAELEISSGCTLECQGDNDGTPTEGAGVIINATNVTIEAGGAISALGLGFVAGEGPGTPTGGSSPQRCGGGHGGEGGVVWGAVAPTYGSETAPVSLGSGSGSGSGYGGGAIKLVVSDTLTVGGAISADGMVGKCTNYLGGGSGGSIWIIADTLTGSGVVSADGGDGGATGNAGGGGGGRIAAYLDSDDSSVSVTADGGSADNPGEDGTIVWE